MKITKNEQEWIQNRIIYEVKDSVKRSEIEQAARSLSLEAKDPDNAYWLFLNHFVDPKNESDLKEALQDVDPVNLFESTTNYETKKKRSGGKRTKK
jgi:hypothetical protein